MTTRPSLQQALDLLRLPRVRVEMSGDERARALYRAFTRRHARWRLIQNRAWGVALLEIPEDRAAYETILTKQGRRQIKLARKAGLTCRPFEPLDHLDEVMAIHRSAPERQGHLMHPDYLDEARVRQNLAETADVMGVFDADGVLRGYLSTRTCGEVVCLERVLGHAAFLSTGMMYLLVSGVVDWLIIRREADCRARWFMYDSFPGASPGLRAFKNVVGFRPYRVSWRWRDG